MDKNGYPQYRRRNTELLEMFNCHMNVEAVSSVSAVRYLYKYIYKGHDAASVTIGESEGNSIVDHDEIKNFIETRYVGPVEVCYRILSKPVQENVDDPVIMNNLNNSSSMLLDYFKLNISNENARQNFYSEIPTYFTYKKTKNGNVTTTSWNSRKQRFNCIGRMFSISPTQVELFYLRLLLLHIKGNTSYNDLKTVDGILQPSFTATCLTLRVIEDDDEWIKAMNEATVWMMPQRLQLLFVRILIHCQPIHPEELWENFKDAMSEDYSRTNDKKISHQLAYSQINNLLNREGRSLADFPTMEQSVIANALSDTNDVTVEQASERGYSQYDKLNNEQKEIVDKILTVLREENIHNSTCFFLKGPGGSRKTFVYTTIYNILFSENIKVCSMAFTEIAATLLPNGGDFRQLLPIKVRGTRSEILNLSIKYSNLWKYFLQIKLTTNMRVLPQEAQFVTFLLNVGDARNIDVNDINEQVTDLLDKTTEHVYTGVETTDNCDNGEFDSGALLPEYLNSFNPPSLPPYKLRLRKNCIITLIRNISINEVLFTEYTFRQVSLGD
ncbi:uncharacterized protein LOC111643039 [Copidosoma floridanum]|uniref:uncharacterized protein LOC111643039 n=1 Tax=Copidosoma floridanum TaxID=29053 RepID=UPI000C6F65AA|nr:uncharacterized protein LOC111643039 [Copidosoma floridanum]